MRLNFEEYQRVANTGQNDFVRFVFFYWETIVGQQHCEYAKKAKSDLHAYTELFVATQGYAFNGVVERYADGGAQAC